MVTPLMTCDFVTPAKLDMLAHRLGRVWSCPREKWTAATNNQWLTQPQWFTNSTPEGASAFGVHTRLNVFISDRYSIPILPRSHGSTCEWKNVCVHPFMHACMRACLSMHAYMRVCVCVCRKSSKRKWFLSAKLFLFLAILQIVFIDLRFLIWFL